jgi:predicted PurR-regulated permease PerM
MPTTRASPAWGTRDVLRVAALVAAVYLGLRLFWVAQDIFFLAFVGVLFGLTLSAAADRAAQYRIPRGVAAPAVLLLVLGLIAALTLFAAPQVTRQLREVQEQIPEVLGKVRGWFEHKVGGVSQMLGDSTAADSAKAPMDSTLGRTRPDEQTAPGQRPGPPAQLHPRIEKVGRAFFAVFSSTISVVGGLILVLFITVFIAVDPGLYRRGLTHLVPHRDRARLDDVLHSLALTLRRWLVTQLIAMVVIGVVTALAMSLLGVRGAIALGVIAGLLEFIPFVGPIASAIPAVAMGLLDSPEKAVYVAIAFTVIQQAEGHLLIPLLMKDSLDLPPVLTLVSQAVMATVFGFLGLLVAVPLLATVMVGVKLLYVEDVVGDEVEVPT